MAFQPMPSLPELRNFLEEYRLGNIGYHNPSGTDFLPPDGFVAQSQKKHWGAADEHRIPLEQYEIRVNEAGSPENPSQEFRFKDVPYAVEEVWDSRVAESGLAACCTYVPFHEAPDEYGIYIQQRGLRWLGHLFYEWSRVEDRANGFDKQVQTLREYRLSETNELLFGTPSFGLV